MRIFSSYSDEQLVRLLQRGDEPAFTEIYKRYWKALYSSAYNVLQVKAAAEDVIQEIFISLWKRRSSVKIESLKAYLLQAVRFQVFKAIRAEKTNADFYKRLAAISSAILIENPLLFKELDGLLQQVFDLLPADEKEIFRLHRENGLTYKQIAEKKSISVKTVEKKMSQALKRIRYGLDEGFVLILLAQHFSSIS